MTGIIPAKWDSWAAWDDRNHRRSSAIPVFSVVEKYLGQYKYKLVINLMKNDLALHRVIETSIGLNQQ